jgi:hypothetical protein
LVLARNTLNPSYFNESLTTPERVLADLVVKDDFLTCSSTSRGTRTRSSGRSAASTTGEVAIDTTTMWRIGDGTAASHNYIYQTIAGFTEDEVAGEHGARRPPDRGEAMDARPIRQTPWL